MRKNSSTPELGLSIHFDSPTWRLTVLSSCFSNGVGLRLSSVLAISYFRKLSSPH